MITAKNIPRHEFIGLKVRVKNTVGKVIDETRNTIKLDVNGKEKTFIKEENSFEFTLPNGEIVVLNGEIIVSRPEDRVKKKLKKW